MTSDERLQDLFDQAVLLNASERDGFIARETGGDPALAAAIRALLAADGAAAQDSYWERSALENEALRAKTEPPANDRIGPYQINGLIGSGGMGQVFRAMRVDAEYSQTVAIKKMRHSWSDGELSARFRVERQILADLDHPNIARLLDGGTDAQGLPYLVMELIEGESLTTHCQTHKLPLAERLRLFREVCAAVQYAHRHMVIHRDLKPANILVSKGGSVKLLDFGIAKLISSSAAGKTAETMAVMLTPGYASPEQVRGEALTTASDIYSLGVILYELLTDKSPYPATAVPHEVMEAVCRLQPAKRSEVAQPRNEALKPWRRKLRGDLDNIAMMALRKDPRERYASVDRLSEDIRCHLSGLPVTARGEALGYVAGKFLRRHKAASLAAGLVLAALVGGIVTTKRAEDRAERRFNQVRKLSHAVVFDYHDAIEALPGSTPLRQHLVKDALEYLDSLATEADDPSLQRELMDAYVRISQDEGNSYHANLGDTTTAMASAGKAIAIGQKLLARNPTPEGRQSLATALESEADLLYGIGKLSEAEGRYQQAVRLRETAMQERPANSENLVGLAGLLRKLGDLNGASGPINMGRSKSAVELYRRAVAITDKLAALQPAERVAQKERFNVLLALASAEVTAGQFNAGEHDLRQAVSMSEAISAVNPANPADRTEMANAYARLGMLLTNELRPSEAAAFIEKSRRIMEQLHLADPKNTLYARDLSVVDLHLAHALCEAGEAAKALPYSRAALALSETLQAADPGNAEVRADVALGHRKLAETLLALHDVRAALDQSAQSVALWDEMAKDSRDANIRVNLGRALRLRGDVQAMGHDWTGAHESYRQAVERLRELVADDPANAVVKSDLARAFSAQASCLTKRRNGQTQAAESYGHAIELWNQLRVANALVPEDARRAEEDEHAKLALTN